MHKTAVQMGRYAAKGAIATIVNVLLMSGFVEVGGLRPTVAAIISTGILIPVLGYPMMTRYVFKTHDGIQVRRLGKYAATILSGKGLNYAVFAVLLHVGVWYPAAWVIGSATVFLGTFTVNRRIWLG